MIFYIDRGVSPLVILLPVKLIKLQPFISVAGIGVTTLFINKSNSGLFIKITHNFPHNTLIIRIVTLEQIYPQAGPHPDITAPWNYTLLLRIDNPEFNRNIVTGPYCTQHHGGRINFIIGHLQIPGACADHFIPGFNAGSLNTHLSGCS